MDALTEMMKIQRKVNSKHAWIELEEDSETRIVHFIDALNDEVHELKREFNWKNWKTKKPWCNTKIHKELTDCLVFFICICMELEVSPKQLLEMYKTVSENNIKRQREGY